MQRAVLISLLTTFVWTASALEGVPVDLNYVGKLSTAQLSRGRVLDDCPVFSNYLELGLRLGRDYGRFGVAHWHYHSLTPRLRGTRDRMFAESDWFVFYSYDWRIADDWTFHARFSPRWFTLPFWDNTHATVFEWYWKSSLDNPYLTPVLLVRVGQNPGHYIYYQPGLEKPIDLGHGFSLVPAFYLNMGNSEEAEYSFNVRPDGEHYHSPLLSLSAEVTLNYRVNDNVRLFATLRQTEAANEEGLHNLRTEDSLRSRDFTDFTLGLSLNF